MASLNFSTPDVPVPKTVPESKSKLLLSSIIKPASFQASIPAIQPYKIPELLKPRNCKGVKYSSFFSSEICGIPPIQHEKFKSANC